MIPKQVAIDTLFFLEANMTVIQQRVSINLWRVVCYSIQLNKLLLGLILNWKLCQALKTRCWETHVPVFQALIVKEGVIQRQNPCFINSLRKKQKQNKTRKCYNNNNKFSLCVSIFLNHYWKRMKPLCQHIKYLECIVLIIYPYNIQKIIAK